MGLKESNLEAEFEDTGEQAILILKVIKPSKGEPKIFLKICANAERVTAELNELSWFALQEFNSNKVDAEIEG